MAYPTFEDALAAVKSGEVDLAMIPIENSVAGRVADIHHLLPGADLYIVGEHFLRVRHQLMAKKGATLKTIKTRAEPHAGARPVPQDAAQARPEAGSRGRHGGLGAHGVASPTISPLAAIASRLAAEIYGLDILKSDVEDEAHNTTRFLVLAKEPDDAEPGNGPVMTTFIFRVRNVPAALYKALGGFATNGVNMTKLESYQLEGSFNATMFFADIEGHPADRPVQLALEELSFFSTELRLLGTYPASPFRAEAAAPRSPETCRRPSTTQFRGERCGSKARSRS